MNLDSKDKPLKDCTIEDLVSALLIKAAELLKPGEELIRCSGRLPTEEGEEEDICVYVAFGEETVDLMDASAQIVGERTFAKRAIQKLAGALGEDAARAALEGLD